MAVLFSFAVAAAVELGAAGQTADGPAAGYGATFLDALKKAAEPLPANTRLILSDPGISVSSLHDYSRANARALSAVLNALPRDSIIFDQIGLSLDQVLETVLAYGEVAVQRRLPDQERRLSEARRLLSSKIPWVDRIANCPDLLARSPTYTRYLDYARRYAEAKADHSPPDQLQLLLDEWYALGKKAEVEAALTTVREAGSHNYASWWFGLQQQLDEALEVDGSYRYGLVDTLPSWWTWADDAGWRSVAIERSEAPAVQRDLAASGVDELFQLWRTTELSPDRTPQEARPRRAPLRLRISFEAKRVRLGRSWFDRRLLLSRVWKWLPQSPLGEDLRLSNGPGLNRGNEVAPLIPTEVILARRVRVLGAWPLREGEDLDHLLSRTGDHKEVAWGPFLLQGRAVGTKEVEARAEALPDGFRFSSDKEVQIIGWICWVTPCTPNPDPALDWTTPLPTRGSCISPP